MSIFVGDTAPSKIFVGDTEVSKVFVGDTQIRPSGWQPGANTFMYLPMKTDFNDATGNNTITNTGVTITTVGGVSCGYFNNKMLTGSVIPSNSIDITFSVWIYPASTTGWIIGSNHAAVYSGDHLFCSGSGILYSWYWTGGGNASVTTGVLPTINTWQHLCYANKKIYLNGTNITSSTGSGTMVAGYPYTIGQQNNGSNSYNGYMSELIVESVGWTADEVADYYNQTKGNYGL